MLNFDIIIQFLLGNFKFYLNFFTEEFLGHLVTGCLWNRQHIPFLLYNPVIRYIAMLSYHQVLLKCLRREVSWSLGHWVSMEQAPHSIPTIQSCNKISCNAFISSSFNEIFTEEFFGHLVTGCLWNRQDIPFLLY